MAQVRVPFNGLLSLLQQLVHETLSWETVMKKYVVVCTGDVEELEEEGAAGASASAGTENKAFAASADPSLSASSTASVKTQVSDVPVVPVVIQYTTRGSFSRPNPDNTKK